MENIDRTHFMVLTGHLDDQPLPDLIRTLRVQRKSGRLQVEYTDAPGLFFFEDGQLVDAQLGSLRGLEAVYAALALDGAAFNFNPLVRPPERSIDRQQQKFITDLVEAPRRDNLAEIKIAGGNNLPAHAAGATGAIATTASATPAPLQLAPIPSEALAPLEQRLTAVEAAIHATSRRFSRERLIYAIVISFLVGLTAVTALQALLNTRKPTASATGATDATRAGQKVDAANGTTATAASGGEATRGASGVPVKKEGEGVAAAVAPNAEREGGIVANSQATGATRNAVVRATALQNGSLKASQPVQPARDARKNAAAAATAAVPAAPPVAARGDYVVRVLMEVRDGQVTEARVLNPRPGAGDYESLALRMARQRRYPKNFTGGDTWNIRVKP